MIAVLASAPTDAAQASGTPTGPPEPGAAQIQSAASTESSTPGGSHPGARMPGAPTPDALTPGAPTPDTPTPGEPAPGSSPPGDPLSAAGQEPKTAIGDTAQPPAGELAGQSPAGGGARASTLESNTANAPATAPPPAAAGPVATYTGTPSGKQPSTASRASSKPAGEASLAASTPRSATRTDGASGASAPATPTGTPRAGAHRDAGDTRTLGVPDAARSTSATGESGGGTGSVASLAQATSAGATSTTLAGAGQAPQVSYGVGLQQAIEAAHAAIQVAARQGLSQARIALQPEELGEIRIYLSQTNEGLVARLTAQTPAAAQALAAGHAELRQSLSSIGLSLAHLEIGHLDQSGAQGSGNQHRPGGQAPLTARAASRATAAEGHEDSDAGPTAQELAPQALAPSSGALVDVLA